MVMELHADIDGYVRCPRRGEISAEWCQGCPDRVSIDRDGDRLVVVCAVDPDAALAGGLGGGAGISALGEVPDLWR